MEWTGNDYSPERSDTDIFYYTVEHIDLNQEVIRRALASALQRDGICDSLAEAFNLMENKPVVYGWAGVVEEDRDYTVCDEYGETGYGEKAEQVVPITWVEL